MRKPTLSILILVILLTSIASGCNIPADTTPEATVAANLPPTPLPEAAATLPEPITASLPAPTATETPVQATVPVTEAPVPSTETILFSDPQHMLWLHREGEPNLMLEDAGDVQEAALSPSGNTVVYTRSSDWVHFSLYAVNADGSRKRELLDTNRLMALLYEPGHDRFNTKFAGLTFIGNMPAAITWLPDDEHILFTSSPRTEGPGSFLVGEIYKLNTTTAELTLLVNDTDGGLPFPSPDGRYIAISAPERINLAVADGSQVLTDLVTYPYVITYSEYLYYPEIVWTEGGTSFVTIIPSEDPMAPEPGADIWRVQSPSGSAERISVLSDLRPFFWPVLAAGAEKVAYMRTAGDPPQNLADGFLSPVDGSDDVLYISGTSGVTEPHPNQTHLVLYTYNPSEAHLIDSGSNSTLLAEALQGDLRWLSPTEYLYFSAAGSQIELRRQAIGGTPLVLASMPASQEFGPPLILDVNSSYGN